MSPQVGETKEKNKQKGLHQTRKFLQINRIKRQPTELEDIFTDVSDKDLISKIYKEHTKLNTKNKSN